MNRSPSRRRFFFLSLAAIPLGLAMAGVAIGLLHLIDGITNLAFYGTLSFASTTPEANRLGLGVVAVPVIGGLIVGVMARFGSKAIRGHGIPEAMEQILENGSRIPPRLTWLKPLSSAISIGTGGPFGAEGPIIATGGAGGSLLGQLFSTTAAERKTLLAAGAAAGMSATFGSPVSAVLLAVELLLFEFRPRSLLPVALASAVAAAARNAWQSGHASVFAMPAPHAVGLSELAFSLVLGALIGVLAVGVSRAVYAMEDGFERLPIHWMWWPALGSIGVGLIGWLEPRTLGVGYQNIADLLSGNLPLQAAFLLCSLKFVSWTIALGSGTSGGTLAPLLTFGSGLGLCAGTVAERWWPALHIQPSLAALVGMASLFAGASQALLASVVFACETTGHLQALLPLLGGCCTAVMMARFLSGRTIMSEKIARRGINVPSQYEADVDAHTTVAQVMERNITPLPAEMPARELLERITANDPEVGHRQAHLLVSAEGSLAGIITRGDLLKAVGASPLDGPLIRYGTAEPIVAYPDESVRSAVEKLLRHNIGRLPVVRRDDPTRLEGYLGRAAILSARGKRFREESERDPGLFKSRLRPPASPLHP